MRVEIVECLLLDGMERMVRSVGVEDGPRHGGDPYNSGPVEGPEMDRARAARVIRWKGASGEYRARIAEAVERALKGTKPTT